MTEFMQSVTSVLALIGIGGIVGGFITHLLDKRKERESISNRTSDRGPVQPSIIALFSLCGVLLGAALQYFFGRALEARKQMALQRSQSYVDYVKAVALIAQNGVSKEYLSLAADAKTRICIYGSPGVVRCLRAFEDVGASTGSDEGRRATIQLLTEMKAGVTKDRNPVNAADLERILFGSRREALE